MTTKYIAPPFTNKQYEKVVSEAWTLAEDYDEGIIIVQLLPSNDEFITSWQLGNSFESMGLSFSEAEDRIFLSLDCRYYDKIYWKDQEETEENRLSPEDQDGYFEMVQELTENTEKFVLSQQEEYTEFI